MRFALSAALSSKCQRSEEFHRGLHLLRLVNKRRLGRTNFLEHRFRDNKPRDRATQSLLPERATIQQLSAFTSPSVRIARALPTQAFSEG